MTLQSFVIQPPAHSLPWGTSAQAVRYSSHVPEQGDSKWPEVCLSLSSREEGSVFVSMLLESIVIDSPVQIQKAPAITAK
jgi:hypothetical protein